MHEGKSKLEVLSDLKISIALWSPTRNSTSAPRLDALSGGGVGVCKSPRLARWIESFYIKRQSPRRPSFDSFLPILASPSSSFNSSSILLRLFPSEAAVILLWIKRERRHEKDLLGRKHRRMDHAFEIVYRTAQNRTELNCNQNIVIHRYKSRLFNKARNSLE